MTRKRIAIFGAGITGLVTAREMAKRGHEVDVYEADDHVGGLASTFRSEDGFIYDNGPRFIFSTLAEKLGIADQCKPVKYYEDLRVGDRSYLFPFGFARNFGFLSSLVAGMITRPLRPKPTQLGQFLSVYYGRHFAQNVLIPLIEKWSGIPASEMSTDFASRLLPTNVSYVIYSFIKRLRGGITEDYYKGGRYIVYPKGTNRAIFDVLVATPGVRVHLNSPVKGFVSKSGEITSAFVGSETTNADYYVSTIPINALPKLLDSPDPLSGWRHFHYRGIVILFLKVKRPKVLSTLWTWFPEKRFRFYRIAEFKNALPQMAPADKTLIALEFGCAAGSSLWDLSAEDLYKSVAADLKDLYGLGENEILGFDVKRSASAYPVLRKATEDEQRALAHQTPFRNLFLAGRTGMFQYRMMEGSYESAVSCVETMEKAMRGENAASGSLRSTDAYGRPNVVPE